MMNRILLPLAWAFRCGTGVRALSYRRGWVKSRRLGRPVVSVGNLSVGGAGKTPLVECVARVLLQHGLNPSILTRGYARRSAEDLIALEPGVVRRADPCQVGDEPALLARALPSVPIVVSSDRFRAGRVAEERFNVDVHILDDGFQHLALQRDLDIVAVDVTQEFDASAVLPAGRLREPLSALGRAHLVVLTRANLGDPAAIGHKVARIAPQARIFHSKTLLERVVELGTGEIYSPEVLRNERVMAFCGIGNPAAFFAYLRTWGFGVAGEKVWRDHHVYRREEFDALMLQAREMRASALLTTEKDALNFPPPPLEAKNGLRWLVCEIRAEVLEADAFEEAVTAAVRAPQGKKP